MATGPRYRLPQKRRRQERTDYRKRIKMLLSRKPRFVVRLSNRNIRAQVVEYGQKGDRTLASASTQELTKYGWNLEGNTPSAYLVGLLCAKKALKAGTKEAILDAGTTAPKKGSKIFAVLKGATDGGLAIPNKATLPKEERIAGTHIAEYAKKLKADRQAYERQFSKYLKDKIEPEQIPELFKQAKEKILGGI